MSKQVADGPLCVECEETMGVETSTRNGQPCHIRCPRDYPGPVGDALRRLRDERSREAADSTDAEMRHGSGPTAPVESLLWDDPELALVHADPHAWAEAHPCCCEALCVCDEAA